jgi:hypothetical protein
MYDEQEVQSQIEPTVEWDKAREAAAKLEAMLSDEMSYLTNGNKLQNVYSPVAWVRLCRLLKGLELISLNSLMEAAKDVLQGKPFVLQPGTLLNAGGTKVVDDVIHISKRGDVVSFTVSGKLVTANRIQLIPDATAIVQWFMRCVVQW